MRLHSDTLHPVDALTAQPAIVVVAEGEATLREEWQEVSVDTTARIEQVVDHTRDGWQSGNQKISRSQKQRGIVRNGAWIMRG